MIILEFDNTSHSFIGDSVSYPSDLIGTMQRIFGTN